MLDVLTGLVDKSLVNAEVAGEAMRYRMLETVRQYGRDRLAEGEEGIAVRRRHRDYFLSLTEEAAPKLFNAEQAHWLGVLETEHDNLRQALTFCAESGEGGEEGLRLAGAIQRFWLIRGHFTEGREWLRVLLSCPGAQGRTKARANALNAAGALATHQGDYAVARVQCEESLAIQGEVGDTGSMAASFMTLGVVSMRRGDYGEARALFEAALSLNRELGSRTEETYSLTGLGIVAMRQGDYAEARALFEASLSLNRELGSRTEETYNLTGLGIVAMHQGDYSEAGALHEAALSLNRELGHRVGEAESLMELGSVTMYLGDYAEARALKAAGLTIVRELGDRKSTAESLETFASLAIAEEQWQRAACLWGAIAALRQSLDMPLPPNQQAMYDREVGQACAALGDDAFNAAWEQGHALSWEQAVELALGEQ